MVEEKIYNVISLVSQNPVTSASYLSYYSTLLVILWAYWSKRITSMFWRHLAYDSIWVGVVTSTFSLPMGLYNYPHGFIYLACVVQMTLAGYRRWYESPVREEGLLKNINPILKNPVISPLLIPTLLPRPWLLPNRGISNPNLTGLASIIEDKSDNKNEIRTEPLHELGLSESREWGTPSVKK